MLINDLNPILSICIPTYNRGKLLDLLLNQLFDLSEQKKSKIQICISDNCSTDTTSTVIDKWRTQLDVITVRQASNIGFTKNFQAVTSLATAPWVVVIGDDDLLTIDGFEALLLTLETVSENTWIFADIYNPDKTTLLEKFSPGSYTKKRFKKYLLLGTLDPFGFICMHIMPNQSIKKLATLNVDQIFGWPHLALLIYDLSNIELYVQREYIVKRCGDNNEVTQTWRANDWLCIMMQKTKLCCYSESDNKIFTTGLALREYLRWPYARQTFHAILLGEKRGDLLLQAKSYINSTNIYKFAKRLLIFYVILLLLFPAKIISWIRKLKNACNRNARIRVVNDGVTDGIERGL
jgi:glycosyltransferase involved in cell wall biosynthesis